MPSKSPAQEKTMRAVAHGWKPPASSGINIPVKVAKEYATADALRKRKSGSIATPGSGAIGGGTAAAGGAGS